MKIHLFLSVKEIDGNRTKENNDEYNLLCTIYNMQNILNI